jgi:hypothetical protein
MSLLTFLCLNKVLWTVNARQLQRTDINSTPLVQDLLKQASRLQSLSMPASMAVNEAEVHNIHTNLSVDS